MGTVSTFFLIAVTLMMATTACNGPDTYQLTISSTAGGTVTTPGEETFTYDPDTMVELVATPDDSYEFDAWTGDTEYITDPNSASTNITINEDCSIRAEFEEEGGPSPSQPY